jgi:hypothetical protein
VVDYLTDIGGADAAPPTVALNERDRDRYVGLYTYGAEPTERLIVALNRDVLTIQRPGGASRPLRYLGSHEFHPVGAEAVRIRFSVARVADRARSVAVYDPDLIANATRATE